MSLYIIYTLERLAERFQLIMLRANDLKEQVEESLIRLLNTMDDKKGLYKIFLQRDIMGNTSLDLMVNLNLYKVLRVELIDRITREVWASRHDQSGSLADFSTSYKLLFTNKLRFEEDQEKRERGMICDMNRDRDKLSNFATYTIWSKSMQIRFLLELLITVAVMIWITVDFDQFLEAKHEIMEMAEWEAGDELTPEDIPEFEDEEDYETFYDDLEIVGHHIVELMLITMVFSSAFFIMSSLRLVYACLTKRVIYIPWILFIDIAILTFNIIWMLYIIEYIEYDDPEENPAFGVEEITGEAPSEGQLIGAAIFYKGNEEDVSPIKVTLIGLYWIRFIFMLQLTKSLGPLIQISKFLLVDFMRFFALYFVWLSFYVVLGMLMFEQLEEWQDFEDGIILML